MGILDFVLVALAFFLAIGMCNLFTRFKWMLGYPPLILDNQQAHITAKEATFRLVAQFKHAGLMPETPDAGELDEFLLNMYSYARDVIMLYSKQIESPTFDHTSDPAIIREKRIAYGELK